MNIQDLAITSIETITAFDVVKGDYLFTLDELQDASISQTQDSAEITGKGGRKLSTLKRNKAVTISGTNGLVSGGLLEMQTGGTFTNKPTEVLWTDYLVIKEVEGAYVAETTYKAVGVEGDEIENLYLKNADGSIGERLTQGTELSATTFMYDPGTRALTFSADNVDKEIVVYYKRMMVANVLVNMSDVYSQKCTLYIDVLAEDKCANVYRVQIFVPKADFSGEFSLEMSDSQTVHAFEAEALAGACGIGGQLWTYTVFGANASDAEAADCV